MTHPNVGGEACAAQWCGGVAVRYEQRCNCSVAVLWAASRWHGNPAGTRPQLDEALLSPTTHCGLVTVYTLNSCAVQTAACLSCCVAAMAGQPRCIVGADTLKIDRTIQKCSMYWGMVAHLWRLQRTQGQQRLMCRWRDDYGSSLVSSGSIFHHTGAASLLPAESRTGNPGGPQEDAVFDPFIMRHDSPLHGDKDEILQQLALRGNVGRQEQLGSTSHSSQHSVEDVLVQGTHRLPPNTQGLGTSVAQQGDTGGEADGIQHSSALPELTTARRHLLQSEDARKGLAALQAAMASNLKNSKWLGDFEPLSMSCPLLGRRVPVEAVSEWAAAAWDCDGLGFAWDCLQPGQ